MKGTTNAVGMRLTALLAALSLCLAPAVMPAQRRPAERRAAPAAPRYSAPRADEGARMRQQQRMNRQQARQNGQYQRQYQGQGGQFQRQPSPLQRQPSQFEQPNRQYQGGNQGEYRAAPAERPYANPEVTRPALPDDAARDGAYSGVNRPSGEAYAAVNNQRGANAEGNRSAQGANRAQPAPASRPAQPPANRPAQPPAAANRYAAPQRYAAPRYTAPPGHLGDWLNQHRNLPVQDQERLLRNSPSFNRLPQDQQQRLVQQLHRLNQMPEPERQRRLAWGEAIEHMSPQDRTNLNNASRQFADLPPGRKAMVKQAFQDLRTVPADQRQTVLNSARYQNNFSPQERDILNNFLKVEPYQQPAR